MIGGRSGGGRATRFAAWLLALVLLLVLARTARGQTPRGQTRRGSALDSVVPPSPVPNGFIADGGPVLDAAARDRLNARIAAVQRATGGDIGVAIVRDLRGRAPADVGVAIYRAWKIGHVDSIGSARRALGALLLIVPKELAPSGRGECWITTGRGAEATLVDAHAGAICRDSVVPHLRTRDYAGAVGAGVDGIAVDLAAATADAGAADSNAAGARAANANTAAGSAALSSSETRPHDRRWLVGALLGTGLLGGALGGAAYRRRRPRYCPRGHGKMVRLSEAEDDAALDAGQRVEERVGSVDYDVWACPVCDERLVIPYPSRFTSVKGCPSCGYRTVRQSTRTLVAATQVSTGLEEITLHCEHCGWHDVTRRTTPMLPTPSSSSSSGSSGSGGGGGGSSFGGSGSTAGGGGGASY